MEAYFRGGRELFKGLEDEADAVAAVTKNLEDYNRQQAQRQALARSQNDCGRSEFTNYL